MACEEQARRFAEGLARPCEWQKGRADEGTQVAETWHLGDGAKRLPHASEREPVLRPPLLFTGGATRALQVEGVRDLRRGGPRVTGPVVRSGAPGVTPIRPPSLVRYRVQIGDLKSFNNILQCR